MKPGNFVLFELMKANPSKNHWALMGKPYNTFKLCEEFLVLGLKSHKIKKTIWFQEKCGIEDLY